MSKCLICENIYPSNYSKCPICDCHLVKEQFKKQETEDVEYEPVSPYVVSSTSDDMDGGE